MERVPRAETASRARDCTSLGVDPTTTTIAGNVFGAGVVTQVSTN